MRAGRLSSSPCPPSLELPPQPHLRVVSRRQRGAVAEPRDTVPQSDWEQTWRRPMAEPAATAPSEASPVENARARSTPDLRGVEPRDACLSRAGRRSREGLATLAPLNWMMASHFICSHACSACSRQMPLRDSSAPCILRWCSQIRVLQQVLLSYAC